MWGKNIGSVKNTLPVLDDAMSRNASLKRSYVRDSSLRSFKKFFIVIRDWDLLLLMCLRIYPCN